MGLTGDKYFWKVDIKKRERGGDTKGVPGKGF